MNTAHDIVRFVCHGERISFAISRPDDHIQRHIQRSEGFYESDMLEAVACTLPERGCVVDVGANIGNHSIFFAKVTGADVIAFEPNPAALDILRLNIKLNGVAERIELHDIAVGERQGLGTVQDHDPNNLGRASVELSDQGTVAIRTLDAVVGARWVDLIKVDVEGMEPMVLRGAAATLARCRPRLLVEAATPDALAGVEQVLRPMGYRKTKVFNSTPTYLFVHDVSKDGETSWDRVRTELKTLLPPTRRIVAGMATVAGNEEALRAAVMSLLPQVDHLYLYLNGYSSVPAFLNGRSKVSVCLDADGKRYGDAGKFWGLAQSPEAIYLSCDDDIAYPADYVEVMVAELAQTRGRAVVGVHGALITQPCEGYYRDGSRTVFHFERPLMRRRRVHVLGTATCVFHTGVVAVTLEAFELANMADIWLAKYLQAAGIAAFAVPRPARWLTALEVKRPTIYDHSRTEAGSAFDSSRQQDRVLGAMYPLSVLLNDAGAGQGDRGAHVLRARSAEGVAEFLAAVVGSPSTRQRDPVFVIVCDAVDADMRAAVRAARVEAEVHLLSTDSPQLSAYRELLSRLGDGVRNWVIQAGNVLEGAPSGSWRRWLGR